LLVILAILFTRRNGSSPQSQGDWLWALRVGYSYKARIQTWYPREYLIRTPQHAHLISFVVFLHIARPRAWTSQSFVHWHNFWALWVKILVFPSTTLHVVSLVFLYQFEIYSIDSSKVICNFLEDFSFSTCYFSNSTNSFVSCGRFSPFI
jgi:hypothetical protein